MAPDGLAAVHETIRQLWDVGAIGRLTDAQLLRYFLTGPAVVAETAFAGLVERHGPMVRRVCLDVLADSHDADDAAQAAFLVLARRARSIRKPEALGPWLHGVAVRLARRLGADAARRRKAEQHGGRIMAAHNDFTAPAELEPYIELHEEIDRLPRKYRDPIVLCYLEGQTQEQAARRLAWPLGTVQTRLHRGRQRLRVRLARRGVGPAVVAAAALTLPPRVTTAAGVLLPADWARATAAAAVGFAARQSGAGLAAPQALAEGLLAATSRFAAPRLVPAALAMLAAVAGAALSVRMAPAPPSAQPVAPARVAVAVAQPTPASEPAPPPPPPLPRKGPDLETAIQAAAHYLKAAQQADGTWKELDKEAPSGVTSLVTLALLAADEPADSPAIRRATESLRRFTPEQLRSVYAISLQTRVFAALHRAEDIPRIARNAEWLAAAQIQPGDRVNWPGSWSYNQNRSRHGDNSNTFFALRGLEAAAGAGVAVKPEVWALASRYLAECQRPTGAWAYTADDMGETASMTCGSLAGLLLCRSRRTDEAGRGCGTGPDQARVHRGWQRLGATYEPGLDFGNGRQWRFYRLDGLELVGRLTGERLLAGRDWFRVEAEGLLAEQDAEKGSWQGVIVENERLIATSFALLFLCEGRAPVVVQKARHGPGDDWNNDPDDVRLLVESVARDERRPLSWEVVDLAAPDAAEQLRAPVLFLNGHEAPRLGDRAKRALRDYVDRGGLVCADDCCGKAAFDRGLRALVQEVFPEPGAALHRLGGEHPVWTARHALKPNVPLWGVDRGGRTVVIYSPEDLSCDWNDSARARHGLATLNAVRIGQNVVAYARRHGPVREKIPETK